MKVYKIELLILDHDELGPDEIRVVLENTNYPNDCIRPRIASVEEAEVEWTDDHPLNRAGWITTFRKLFSKS